MFPSPCGVNIVGNYIVVAVSFSKLLFGFRPLAG